MRKRIPSKAGSTPTGTGKNLQERAVEPCPARKAEHKHLARVTRVGEWPDAGALEVLRVVGRGAAEEAAAVWLSLIQALAADDLWRRWHDPGVMRTLLVRLHETLRATPDNLLQEFDQRDETALKASARQRLLSVNIEELFGRTPRQALDLGAAILRALDEALLEGAETLQMEAPECWQTADGRHYVVPIPRAVMREGGPRTLQSFDRRGLLHHRIIPTRIGDVDIILEPHPDVTEGAQPTDRIFGAALFNGLQLTLENVDAASFLVTAVQCVDGVATVVGRHVDAAQAAKCDTVVWPELTMDPDVVGQLQTRLASDPLTTRAPPVVVAGSWHVAGEARSRNMAPVLTGRGAIMFEFGKNRRFTYQGMTEDIEVYGAIHILVTDRELIAFAICKDFCDKAQAVPVTQLDVDLVLVPSMGESSTMTAHREAADLMKVRFGARTVVVQQRPQTTAAGGPSYVLQALREPRRAELSDLATRLEFTTFQQQR